MDDIGHLFVKLTEFDVSSCRQAKRSLVLRKDAIRGGSGVGFKRARDNRFTMVFHGSDIFKVRETPAEIEALL